MEVSVSFDEQLTITLIDKGLLAIIVLVAGFALNSLLERQKAAAGLEQAQASERAEAYGKLWASPSQ